MQNSFTTIRVEFPALDNLVAYLRENQQAKLNALAAEISDLTKKLQHAQTGLDGSVKANT